MKKIILLALVVSGLQVVSQTSIALFQQGSTVSVAPNTVFYANTTPKALTKITVDITNKGASTNYYLVKRYDMTVNWIAIGDSAVPNFCFGGQCFGTEITTSPAQLALELMPGQSSAGGEFTSLDADIVEGTVKGFSFVKYTIFNQNNVNDSVQISIRYNDPAVVGVKENAKKSGKMEIFPNPAKDNANFVVTSTISQSSKLVLFNSIGAVVLEKDILLSEGRNTVALSLSELSTGIYIAQFKDGSATVTKKLIVE